MPSLTPKELLDYLLQDNTLGQDELGQFIQEHPDYSFALFADLTMG
jgi:hypothetical protein